MILFQAFRRTGGGTQEHKAASLFKSADFHNSVEKYLYVMCKMQWRLIRGPSYVMMFH